MENSSGKSDLVGKSWGFLDVFLWAWMLVFNCLILPVGLGLLWLASGVIVAVFEWIDRVIVGLYDLSFTYRFLFISISIIFGVCLTIYKAKKGKYIPMG